MRLFAFLALAGSVAAFSLISRDSPQAEDQELQYKFVSQVLTGIPQLSSQYSGWRLTGLSTIQPGSERSYKLKLSNMKYLSINDQLEVSAEKEILSSEEHELPSQIKQQLETPYKVSINPSGQVEAIYTESSEPEMITNIKKSLVNNNFEWLQGSRMIDTNQIHRDQDDTEQQPKGYFKTFEKSLEGDCEVEYSVHKMADYQIDELEKTEEMSGGENQCQDQDYYQVVKTVNYQNCRERPLYQRSVGSQAKSDGSSGSSSPYLSESSLSRSVWCGPVTAPVLRKQTTEQKVVVSGNGKFDSQEKIEVTSRVTNTLISFSSKSSDIPEPQSVKKSHDLTFSFPSGDFWTSTSSSGSQHSLPQPSDLTSRPATPYPSLSSEQAKTKFVSLFVSMMEDVHSGHHEEDIHSQTGQLSYLSTMLSYEDIKDCWSRIQQRLSHDIAVKENALSVFCDILSLGMAPTNPSIKFIIEKIQNKQIKGESAAWVAANMIRSVQTPTEKTIQELTNFLVDCSSQQSRDLTATVAMSLTELIYKACVDETSSSYNYPSQVYGKFCSPSSKAIKVVLIPYLKQSLEDLKPALTDRQTGEQTSQPSIDSMNSLISLINALGNLGIEEASQALLEVVEGAYTQHPHPRSMAVYNLIRSAQQNPTKYRPVILSIIQNTAEHEEVRMAAVTALPYVQPSSAQLQKLAGLTWYDSQQQVSAFISSTLQSLSQLPSGSQESYLSQKAGEALKLAKPTNSSGIHKSQNIQIKQFLESLKASVGLNLQYVNSEESAFPRTMYLQSQISSKAQTMKPFESSLYLQGADTLLDQLYGAYKSWSQLSQQEKPQEKLGYEPRKSKNPEAHLTLKMFDLQRFFSVDSDYFQQVAREMAEEMSQQGAVKKEKTKVLDLSYHQVILPSVTGLPLYYHHRVPLMMSARTSLTTARAGTLEMKIKPSLNYQQKTRVGTLCPFTQQYLGAGVETSLNITVPLRAELSLQNGQVSITLKTPGDAWSQRDKSVVQFKVNPYTFNEGLFDSHQQKKEQYKTIHTKSSKYQRQYEVGKPLGLDLKLKVDSEHEFADLASILSWLGQHQTLTGLSLPLPLQSCRHHQVSLHYSPARSQTQEASLIFSLGYGSKQSLFGEPKVHFPLEVRPDLERQCRQEISEEKWSQQQPEPEDSEDEEEERKYWREKSQDNYRQKLKAKLSEERRVYQCLTVKRCDQEKSSCQSQLRSEHRPSDEIEAVCSQKKFQCVQQTKTAISSKSLLYKLRQGNSVTCSAAVLLRTENQQKMAEVRTTVGQSSGNDGRTKVQLTASWQPSQTSQPQQVIFTSTSQVEQPRSKWNKMSILRQELSAQVDLKLSYGQKDQAKQSASASISLSQSPEQKSHALQSEETSQCSQQTQQGRTLTSQCKEARRQSGSLDTIQAQVSLPASVSQSRVLKTLSDISKAYVAPYIEEIHYHHDQPSDSQGNNQYLCTLKIHPQGQQLSVNVQSKENDLKLKDIRVVKSLQGLLPINIQDTGSENIIQKLTSRQAPSTCSLEHGKVKTFDSLEYDYQLNDCEHVVFKDCSQSSRVEVSVQEKSSKKTVKVTIDNHQYELKIPSTSGSQQAVIKVNGEEKTYIKKQDYEKRKQVEEEKQNREYQQTSKQAREEQEGRKEQREKSEFAEQKKNFYQDKGTYVTSYEDGVYAVVNGLYGLAVYTDGKSLEVQTYQHLLRNKACGLCGDLNDEKVGDVKSPGSCIMSSPALAAQTYMVPDQTCQAPSQEDQERIRQETEQWCVKKQTFPTQVSHIYRQPQPLYSKHLVEYKENKICFSTQQVKVCPSNSNPQEIKQQKVSYYCLPKDSQSKRMEKMAEQGEFIPQHQEKHPISYSKIVSQPEQC